MGITFELAIAILATENDETKQIQLIERRPGESNAELLERGRLAKCTTEQIQRDAYYVPAPVDESA